MQLFVDRAQAVRPDFQVTNQNAAAVAELCDRLEGLPLAIELAAARAQVLTPAQMLRQLAHRFEFLVSRRRDGAERHQTLRAAMDWSYRLLPAGAAALLRPAFGLSRRLDLEAAEAVCGGAFGARLPGAAAGVLPGSDGGGRRGDAVPYAGDHCGEFAGDRLASGEPAALRGRHADYFLALAEEQSAADRRRPSARLAGAAGAGARQPAGGAGVVGSARAERDGLAAGRGAVVVLGRAGLLDGRAGAAGGVAGAAGGGGPHGGAGPRALWRRDPGPAPWGL